MKIIAFPKWLIHKPVAEIASTLKDAGFDGVDYPVRSGSPVTHETAAKQLPQVMKVFQDHGLSVDRVVTSVVAPEPHLDSLLATCADLGIRKIRLGSRNIRATDNAHQMIDQIRTDLEALEPYLEKHGVSAALQTHSGNCAELNVGLCLLYLRDRDPKWLGVQLDPGHLSISSEPPEAAISLLGPYLHSVNAKAARRDPVIHPRSRKLVWPVCWVPLRDGMTDWEAVLRRLFLAGYDESISVHGEYRSAYYQMEHDAVFVTEAAKADCAYLRTLLKQVAVQ